ncbi:MAG: ABC transporter ATP-binding protein [Syntrophomonadaceae bacterium]|nr:ABC transporter ATP-binding protein [Syntrophomonadaceae bacterium]
MELEIKHVSKKYPPSTMAVDDFSVTLTPGVWGLLGANGAGKTTLMKMMCGILRPTGGKILFDGQLITILDEKYRDVLGYLPQVFGFHQDFRVYDYLMYIAVLKGLAESTAKKKIVPLLEQVSLTASKNTLIRNLSGGMKRRVGIAQALLNDPQVLILDEPTAGLDPTERIHFRKILSAFSKDRIVLLSTHIVSDVEHISKRNLIMKKGKLLVNGTTEELVSSLEEKVWKCVIPAAMLESVSKSLSIINMRNEANDMVSIRYIAEKPIPNSELQAPHMEDVYLSYFPRGLAEEVSEHV